MLPRTSDIVVIGGGVIGTSVAFHLARMGPGSVTLLERSHLAAGATGLSSGLVRMHYDNPLEAEFAFKSLPTFRHFNEIVGGDCGFTPTGFLQLVKGHNLEALKANVAMLQALGIRTNVVTADELGEMAPYLETEDVPLAAYEPDSGYADPHMTTIGLAEAARRHGARIFQGVEVNGIDISGGRVTDVQTPQGSISTPIVVNAAGPWGALVAKMAGVPLDLTVIHHQVAIIETTDRVRWPHLTIIDDLNNIYLRPESGRLTLVGGNQDDRTIGIDTLDTYSQGLSPDVRDRTLESLCARIPAMAAGCVHKGHAGIYPRTRDKHALMGQATHVEGFFCATGFSGHGFKEAPVVGQAMAELILQGRSEVVDITPLRLTRFQENQPYRGPNPYL